MRTTVCTLVAVALLTIAASQGPAAEPTSAAAAALTKLGDEYARDVRPVVKTYCLSCHSTAKKEGELDLEQFASLAEIRRRPSAWQKVVEMLDHNEMPPQDAKQPSAEQKRLLRGWVERYLAAEALANAGDPGPVTLRRLNNAEYTYTLRDLTGVTTLNPAREFPVDSAAGEGFTNTGAALVMSPALLTKYLDAGKDVAAHAVLLPDGLRFSPHVSRRDLTDESLAQIRTFYQQFTDDSGGSAVNLQGIQFNTNQGGRLPLAKYLAATLTHRDALAAGTKSPAEVAREAGLSPKYLQLLWAALSQPSSDGKSPLLEALRAKWRVAKPSEAAALVTFIGQWQEALWKFNSIGHIGRLGGPKSWLEALSPLVPRQEFRVKLPAATATAGDEVVVYLAAGDAGDGHEGDYVVWERPRLVAPGRPEVLLRDVRDIAQELAGRRERLLAQTAQALAAAAEASTSTERLDVAALAKRHAVEPESLAAWLDYLGIGAVGPAKLGTPLSKQATSGGGYNFIQGWVGDDALSIVANSSDQQVRIPGTMKPHSVAVHPAPSRTVAVGWRSHAAATLKITGLVLHAHPECGNGVAWSIELRRGNTRQRLAAGTSQGTKEVPLGPLEKIAVQPGDVVTLVVDPRDGNHSCDLTTIDLTLHDGRREWNLTRDVSPNILASNPHADGHGQRDVWHFFSEPTGAATGQVIPAGSLLAKWQSTADAPQRQQWAAELQRLLQQGPGNLAADAPDRVLHQQLTSLGGPLLSAALQAIAKQPTKTPNNSPNNSPAAQRADSRYGLSPAQFGTHPPTPDQSVIATVDRGSLCLRAPTVLEVRLPASLVAGAELVTAGSLHAVTGREGSVQLQVTTTKPDVTGLSPKLPIMTPANSAAQRRLETALAEFRELFPPALAYTKIVPVDEVVTLTLFYREDYHLARLMLDGAQAARLERLWDELLYVSQEPLLSVNAIEQLAEFATQDRPDLVPAFKPVKESILKRAEAFRQRLVQNEPEQLAAVLKFADQAYRRPVTAAESQQLRDLYHSLRRQAIGHDEALRLTLARVLVAPAFLYRGEAAPAGAAPQPVSDWELATRLSYFLWSSAPDNELRETAAAGKLREPATLVAQTRRMLRDPKARRLAIEFACQWLHIRDFAQFDEKSERHFPTFAPLREAMLEEAVLFFADLVQSNRSIMNILDADYTFLNAELAKHYGIPGVEGPHWRRVDGVRQYGRGGMLAFAANLSKQAGASRTSPILRGAWLSEVVLGEKLPKPPKNVPQLADDIPQGLTERQLTERHSSDPACMKCHARIDPFGYALENYDAIGRWRLRDAGGLAIDVRTKLPDGTPIDGPAALRTYLATTRREAFVKQFLRKLLGYSLGRSVQLSDEPLLTAMHAKLAAEGYPMQTALEMIVTSRQFQTIRGREQGE